MVNEEDGQPDLPINIRDCVVVADEVDRIIHQPDSSQAVSKEGKDALRLRPPARDESGAQAWITGCMTTSWENKAMPCMLKLPARVNARGLQTHRCS